MRVFFFLFSMAAATVYLAVAAIEDHKSCQVTRWKHLIGFIPAFAWFLMNIGEFMQGDIVVILAFAAAFIGIGYMRVYGLADGFVFANLTFLFGGTGGAMGVGMVILIILVASFSFFICNIWQNMLNKKNIFHNEGAAFIPHVMIGYVVTILGLIFRSAM